MSKNVSRLISVYSAFRCLNVALKNKQRARPIQTDITTKEIDILGFLFIMFCYCQEIRVYAP